MADVKQIELNSVYYHAKDVTARTAITKLLNDVADTFSTAVSYAVGDVVLYDGDLYRFTSAHSAGAWDSSDVTAVSVTDLLDILQTNIDKEVLYFASQNVSVANNAQMIRIPASGTDSKITTDTVLLRCDFANGYYVDIDYSWQSYNGYFVISGTCTSATTANVTLGKKGN